MISWLDYFRELNIWSMMLRVFFAMLAGGVIGFERERKGRPAGFRTYILVALGAALTVMLSQYLNAMFDGPWSQISGELGIRTDVSRLGAQVINGVGFLGAGTIIVTGRREVKGLTTAAGLWASACMGLAIGAGFYECMAVSFLLIIICMKFLPYIENAIMSKAVNMNIYLEVDNIENLSCVISFLKRDDILLYDVDIDKEQHEHISQINALLSVRLPIRLQHTELLAALSTLEGVITIEEV
ncbi:MAG: MgtC/SapB family protein [Candidatus Limivicinus sp.]|nr:MgtC/SapB family protein [Clostridiales bacterium]MDY3859142.1 MgtC/SapB family protein [Candidatus Limivicinus sp.]